MPDQALTGGAIRQLDNYYGLIKRQILYYQSPITGLYPADSTDEVVGDVRSSVYASAAVWGLYQAYKRNDDDRGKSYELGQSAVKCMRGILECWMKQADRLELFKKNQCVAFALHVKFDLSSGAEVFTDAQYNHLQIDVISIYLIYMVQMITSGLQIVYTQDEVAFVQNLVYYVERAYRIPDFGIWEMGSKYNDGTPEIHASSIGLAKSALEAINGCNLFGEKGSSWSVIYVDIDAHNRNRSIFETLLPRESSSKEVDSALLQTISYPGFATHAEKLCIDTKNRILQKLKGKYGFKRFNRDGFGTAIVNKKNRFYEKGDVKSFDGIECQWPMFYMYMIIDGVFKSLPEQISEYQKMLKKSTLLSIRGDPIIPQYFYIPGNKIFSNEDDITYIPSSETAIFLWNQALYILSQLLTDGLLHVNELDPIRRYLPSHSRPRKGGRYSAFQGIASDLVVQIVLIAESARLQAMMATYGIQTQTPQEVEPVHIWSSSQLVDVYEHLGVNKKLGLQGRPRRPIGSLGTSKIYRICGMTVLCYPLIFEVSDFYLYRDMALLIDDIQTELRFIGRHWRLSGRPTVCLLIREEHMRDPQFKKMLDLFATLRRGASGLKVRMGRLQNLISSSCVEHLDFMNIPDFPPEAFKKFNQLQHDYIGYQSLTDIPKIFDNVEQLIDYKNFEHRSIAEILTAIHDMSDNLYVQCQLYGFVLRREGPSYQIQSGITIRENLENLYHKAGAERNWAAVRYASSLMELSVDSISPFITAVLVHGKQLTVGVVGQTETTIDRPLTPAEVRSLLYSTIQSHDVVQAVLQQEIILYCGRLIGTRPQLFRGVLTIRVGWVLEAMKCYLRIKPARNGRSVETQSPFHVRKLVDKLLSVDEWANTEALSAQQRRQLEGCLCRVPESFYDDVWNVLKRTPNGIVVMGKLIPQQPTLSNMSQSENTFALLVEQMLNLIQLPEYRQLVVELLNVVSIVLKRNPELSFSEPLDVEQLLKDAGRMYSSDHSLMLDKVSYLFDISREQAMSYLARATVNTMLKGGKWENVSVSATHAEACSIT